MSDGGGHALAGLRVRLGWRVLWADEVFVQIRSADASPADGNSNTARSKLRFGNVVESDVFVAMPAESAHFALLSVRMGG